MFRYHMRTRFTGKIYHSHQTLRDIRMLREELLQGWLRAMPLVSAFSAVVTLFSLLIPLKRKLGYKERH